MSLLADPNLSEPDLVEYHEIVMRSLPDIRLPSQRNRPLTENRNTSFRLPFLYLEVELDVG